MLVFLISFLGLSLVAGFLVLILSVAYGLEEGGEVEAGAEEADLPPLDTWRL